MQNIWIKYSQKFNDFSIKIKALTLVGLLFLIFIFWLTIAWQPLEKKNQEIKNQINNTSQQIAALQQQIATDQNTLDALKQQLTNLSKTKTQTNGPTYTSPQKMVDTLKRLASEKRFGLNITSFSALPVKTTMFLNGTQQLLEQNIVINLVGNYFATMSYIKSIEQLNWPIYWDYLSYNVTKYPLAEITLKIHALSIEE